MSSEDKNFPGDGLGGGLREAPDDVGSRDTISDREFERHDRVDHDFHVQERDEYFGDHGELRSNLEDRATSDNDGERNALVNELEEIGERLTNADNTTNTADDLLDIFNKKLRETELEVFKNANERSKDWQYKDAKVIMDFANKYLPKDQISGTASDFLDNYIKMRQGDFKGTNAPDKVAHCRANYQGTIRGVEGAKTSALISLVREVTDIIRNKNENPLGVRLNDSLEDMYANIAGMWGAVTGERIESACHPDRLNRKIRVFD